MIQVRRRQLKFGVCLLKTFVCWSIGLSKTIQARGVKDAGLSKTTQARVAEEVGSLNTLILVS